MTFPHIAEVCHPLTTGSLVLTSVEVPAADPDSKDIAIATEILKIHSQEGHHGKAEGEWSWINQHGRSHYLDVLRSGSPELLASELAGMFRNDVTFGLTSAGTFESAKQTAQRRTELENQILLDLDTWQEFARQDYSALGFIAMPQVGSPFGAIIDGHLIAADQPRHDYYALKIRNLMKNIACPVILEIGGGYGGLALQMHRRISELKYIDCDLLEGLYITYYFLAKSLKISPQWISRVPDISGRTCGCFLVPAHRADSICAKADLVFNHGSLSEMAQETVNHYIGLIQDQWQPTYFLHQNSNFLLFPNSERHIEVLADEFPIDSERYDEVYRAISVWQAASGRYREFLFKRR